MAKEPTYAHALAYSKRSIEQDGKPFSIWETKYLTHRGLRGLDTMELTLDSETVRRAFRHENGPVQVSFAPVSMNMSAKQVIRRSSSIANIELLRWGVPSFRGVTIDKRPAHSFVYMVAAPSDSWLAMGTYDGTIPERSLRRIFAGQFPDKYDALDRAVIENQAHQPPRSHRGLESLPHYVDTEGVLQEKRLEDNFGRHCRKLEEPITNYLSRRAGDAILPPIERLDT